MAMPQRPLCNSTIKSKIIKLKSLAIIGAGYLQLPLVKRAKEMGLRTLCFAWPQGAVCKEVCDAFYPVSITEKEEIAVKALIRDPRLSAARLADLIGVKQRQAQRIITSLKKKAGLKRRGARKNGEWYFDRV